jgi:hypothetical protein
VPCDDECVGCKDAASTCVACIGSAGLTSSRVVATSCECPADYYSATNIATTPECLICRPECATCAEDSGVCVTCVGSAVGTLASSRVVTSSCACPDGFYSDLNQGNECIACLPGCATCSDGSSCTKCIGSVSNSLSSSRVVTSSCACPTHYYSAANLATTPECQVCSHKCDTCAGAATTCTACAASISAARSTAPACDCPTIGFFDDGVNALCGSNYFLFI